MKENNSIDKKVTELMAKMSLEEKVNQISCRLFIGGMGSAEEKEINCGSGEIGFLGSCTDIVEMAHKIKDIQEYIISHSPNKIPALFHSEGLNGVVMSGTTQYPSAISLGATFDTDGVRKMADEIREQMYMLGIRHVLSPLFDVARDFRWGRINETYGGDPTLVAALGCAYVEGIQGDDLTKGIAATAKHFLGYSYTEGGLNMGKVLADERELREVFAMPFEAVINQSGVKSVMNAYSEINGLPVCTSKSILTDLLRDDLGFDGVVVSDYSSIIKVMMRFKLADNIQDAAVRCLKAGLDVELPAPVGYVDEMLDAVEKGKIDESVIDRAVARILKLKFELGLFENPYPQIDKVKNELKNTNNKETVVELTDKAITLTKNDGILPIKDKNKKIAVIGPSGNSVRHFFGSYTNVANKEMLLGQVMVMEGVSDADSIKEKFSEITGIEIENPEGIDQKATTALSSKFEDNATMNKWLKKEYEGYKTTYEALCDRLENVTFTEGCHTSKCDIENISEAVEAARNADIVILTLGGKNGWGLHCTTGEGVDRTQFGLSGRQEELMKAVYAVNPNVVLVHTDITPIVSQFAYENIPAIIEGFLSGGYCGDAIARVITGELNPGGRLPVDVPRCCGASPVFHYQHNGSGVGLLVKEAVNPQGYVDCYAKPIRPFGYGLSYTKFEYSDFSFEASNEKCPQIKIALTVTNIGTEKGDDVVMLFGRDLCAQMVRPVQEMIGFKRISLNPNEKCRVEFMFNIDKLSFVSEENNWIVEEGDFEFFLGTNSEDKYYIHKFNQACTVAINPNKRCFFADVNVNKI